MGFATATVTAPSRSFCWVHKRLAKDSPLQAFVFTSHCRQDPFRACMLHVQDVGFDGRRRGHTIFSMYIVGQDGGRLVDVYI